MRKTALLALAALLLALTCAPAFAESLTLWFPPDWKSKAGETIKIAEALSASGSAVAPRVAKSYAEIFTAFSAKEPALVYVGSFAQALIKARGLGAPMVQAVTGKEMYSGVLVYPKGSDPMKIMADSPAKIAYAKGASSGESSAKAATGGKAALAVDSHGAACGLVKVGNASAAVVKDWWWEANKATFPELDVYNIPGVSEQKNPDNVLTASSAVSPDVREKLKAAAIAAKDVFGAKEMKPFDGAALEFSLALMKKGGIDPMTYKWD